MLICLSAYKCNECLLEFNLEILYCCASLLLGHFSSLSLTFVSFVLLYSRAFDPKYYFCFKFYWKLSVDLVGNGIGHVIICISGA